MSGGLRVPARVPAVAAPAEATAMAALGALQTLAFVHTAAWLAGVIDSDLVRSYSLNRHINRDCRCDS